jgi:hypothetical protein
VVVGPGLVVADAAAVLGDPGVAVFDDPTAGQDSEPAGVVAAFDHLNSQCQNMFRLCNEPFGIAAVGPAKVTVENVVGIVVSKRIVPSPSWMETTAP